MKGIYRFVTVPLAVAVFLVTALPFLAVCLLAVPFLSDETQTRAGLAYRDFIKGIVEFFD